MSNDSPRQSAQRRLRRLLDPVAPITVHPDGYVDLLGEAPQAGPSTGFAQRLMRVHAVSAVYERWWRPALGRVAKGLRGPSMAGEHRLAVDLLALSSGDAALDVACGTGAFTRTFGRVVGPEGLAVGLDGSRTMLARACAATGPDEPVAYLRADAVHPPLPPGSLDAVCCFAALHLFDDPEAALSSFARLLRPGGRVALLTTAHRKWFPVRTFDTTVGAVTGIRMFGRAEIADLLHRVGFVDESVRVSGVVQIVGARKG